jgi:hypothetical protein
MIFHFLKVLKLSQPKLIILYYELKYPLEFKLIYLFDLFGENCLFQKEIK